MPPMVLSFDAANGPEVWIFSRRIGLQRARTPTTQTRILGPSPGFLLWGISGHLCTLSLRGVSGHYSAKTGEPPYIQRRHFGAVIAPQYRVKSFHSDYRQQAEWTVVRGARPVHSACFFMAQAQRPGAISSPGSFVVRRFGAPLCSELW